MKKSILLISIVLFLAIVILPFLFMLFEALSKPAILEQIIKICLNERQLKLLANSLFIGFGATLFSLMLGLPLGFFISRAQIYLKGLARHLYLLPLLIPSYISAISWIGLFGSLGKNNSFFIYGPWGAIWVLGLSYFPFISLLTIAGLFRINTSLEEQAQLVVSDWQVIRKITLPLVAPFITAAALFVFVFSVSNYGVPALLRVNTFPIEIFSQFAVYYNHNLAVLSSLPLLLITLALIMLSYFIMKDKCFVSLEGISSKPKIFKFKADKFICSAYVWLVILVSGFLPLMVLIVSSGSPVSYWVALKTSFRPVLTSLWLSALAATFCVVLGFFLAYFIRQQGKRFSIALDIATILPLAIPATVVGIGLIRFWNHPITGFIYSGPAIVVFGFVSCFVPFSIRTLLSNFQQLNSNLEEAAILSGAGFLKTVWKILIPLTCQGILAGWIICFIFSMGELSATLLVVPPGLETLSSKIYTLMHYGVARLTSALSAILILLTIIPVVLLGWIFKRSHYYDRA